ESGASNQCDKRSQSLAPGHDSSSPSSFPVPNSLLVDSATNDAHRGAPLHNEISSAPVDLEGVMLAKLAAEFLGTFWLVLGGGGSAVLAAALPELGIGFAGVSLAFGLTVLTALYALGPISGGHFNPAVTMGLWA